MEKDYCVYMHIFPNGKKYIGITCCAPNRRWQNGYGYVTQVVYRAIKKYGWENVQHDILDTGLSLDEANKKEQAYILKYQTTNTQYGYNISSGGKAGGHIPEEQKQKISRANSGKNNGMYGHHYTPEERRYMSEHSVWRGRKHTAETKAKISTANKAHPHTLSGKDHPMYGKKHTEETRRKMSESAKKRGCCMSIAARERLAIMNRKPISQYDKNGSYIATYTCAQEAARQVGLKSKSGICECANGRINSSGGYVWRYANGE